MKKYCQDKFCLKCGIEISKSKGVKNCPVCGEQYMKIRYNKDKISSFYPEPEPKVVKTYTSIKIHEGNREKTTISKNDPRANEILIIDGKEYRYKVE